MQVVLDIDDGVANVVIDNPPLNLVVSGTYAAVERVVAEAAARTDVHALVLTGAGDRAFSAGADLREVTVAQERSPLERWDDVGRVLAALRSFPVPTFAAIVGHALGAGLVLALSCDIRVGAPDASLGLPEARHGLFGGAGALAGADLSLAWHEWLVVSGQRLDGVAAERIGLLQVVDDDPRARAGQMARELVGIDREILVRNKAVFATVREQRISPVLAAERASVVAAVTG